MSFGECLTAKGEDWLREQIKNYRLGQTWPQATHEQLQQLFFQYLIVGGMPEVVALSIKKEWGQEWREVQDQVIATYRDEFSKYAKKIQIPSLR